MPTVWPGAHRRIWWQALKGVWNSLGQRNVGLMAAGVAFFGILGVFPGMAALIAFWGYFSDPSVIERQLSLMQGFVPPEAFALIKGQLDALIAANSSTLGWTSVVSTTAALWTARSGVGALILGLNSVYREDNRSGVREAISALGLTLALMAVAVVALATVVVVPIVLAVFPLGALAALVLTVLQWVIAALVVLTGVSVVYRYGPNRRMARPAWITPGAIFAVVIWGLVSIAFSVYLTNFGNYNKVYGSIGAVIALLMWLYLSAYVVLLGAALNAELELRTKPDTTVGPAKPMGQRGAYVADHYEAR